MNRFIRHALMGFSILCLLTGCVTLGGERNEADSPGFVPTLPDAATQSLPSTSRPGGGGLNSRQEVELRAEIASLQNQLTEMKPGVDRLLSIENDIRILLQQLAAISDSSLPAPSTSSQAGIQPLGQAGGEAVVSGSSSPIQPLGAGGESANSASSGASPSALTPLGSSSGPTALQPLPSSASTNTPPSGRLARTGTASSGSSASQGPPALTQPSQTILQEERARAQSRSAQASASTPSETPPRRLSDAEASARRAAASSASSAGSSSSSSARSVVMGEDEIFVHLASYRSRDMAQSGWREMVAEYGAILAGLYPRITEADLGERGMYYRLHAGHFVDSQSAQALCQRLAGVNVYCQMARLPVSGT